MDVAPSPGFSDSCFELGQCATCDREVLTYPSFEPGPRDPDDRHDRHDGPHGQAGAGGDDSGDCEHLRCVHCDAVVVGATRAVSGEDLPDVGYGLLELQGCGNPDCGGGRCSREAGEESAS